MRFNWKIIFRWLCWIYEHDYVSDESKLPELLEMTCGTCGHIVRHKGHRVKGPTCPICKKEDIPDGCWCHECDCCAFCCKAGDTIPTHVTIVMD